jgi:hypothetical protein
VARESIRLRRLAEGRRGGIVGFSRFLANRRVTVEALIEGWGADIAEACAGRHVLAIQDTSEINFATTKERGRGLGEIGKGVGRGVLKRPSHLAKQGVALAKTIEVSLVEVREINPPADAEPILWRLLTAHAVEDATIAARAACAIMQLVQARDGLSAQPANIVFSPAEIETLHALLPEVEGKTALQKNPHPPNSLAWAGWIIAKLGGWDGYPKSRSPGPITFRHGLEYFRSIAYGWKLRDV